MRDVRHGGASVSSDFRITGCRVLLGDGLHDTDLTVSSGFFRWAPDRAERSVSMPGLWLLPGLVDLHGDGFERHVAPRRGMNTDKRTGLVAAETELAAAGITTAWLAQFWSWEGGMRGPAFADALASALSSYRSEQRIDLRLQLRFESHMIADGPAVEALIALRGIDYVVFNDHLPHRHLADGRRPPRLTGAALKAQRSPDQHLAVMQALHDRAGEVPGFIAAMAKRLANRGICLGSHDDVDASTRARFGDMGLAIAEFPVTREAAESAFARGDPVVMGAPNVVRGGSHEDGVSAAALVADGLVSALASDYHYPAMVQAAIRLADQGALRIEEAWHLISAGPAAVMGLTDRGRIADGLRADFVLYDPARHQVVGTFSEGRPVFLTGSAAEALIPA